MKYFFLLTIVLFSFSSAKAEVGHKYDEFSDKTALTFGYKFPLDKETVSEYMLTMINQFPGKGPRDNDDITIMWIITTANKSIYPNDAKFDILAYDDPNDQDIIRISLEPKHKENQQIVVEDIFFVREYIVFQFDLSWLKQLANKKQVYLRLNNSKVLTIPPEQLQEYVKHLEEW